MRRNSHFLSLLLLTFVTVAPAAEAWVGLPLTGALERLREAGLKLVYSSPVVPDTLRVLHEPRATDPRQILEELLEPHRLTVQQGPGGTLLVVRVPADASGWVRGRVLSTRGDAPPRARISAAPGGAETQSGRDGRFELRLEPGRYKLTVSAPGFVTRSVQRLGIVAGREVELDVTLPVLEIVHESIRVTGERTPAEQSRPVDQVGLYRDSLEAAPNLVQDPYEDLARLPGVANADTRAEVNIRGGRGDEVLVLFDDLEIPAPYHVPDLGGGLLSVFDSRLIQEVTYYGGAFPSQFGNRTSAVLELNSTVRAERPSGALTVARGLLRASGQGPVGDDGIWLVSGRAGDPELMLSSWVSEDVYSPRYYDAVAKVSGSVGGRTTLAGHLLLTLDESKGDLDASSRVDSEYERTYAWLTADTAWNSWLFSRSLVAWGSSEVERTVSDADLGQVDDDRTYHFVEVKQDWTGVATPRNNLRWGFRLRWQDADYDYRIPLQTTIRFADVSGLEYSLYASDTIRASPTLLVEIGVRYDAETYTGLDDAVTSPRFNLAWSPDERTTLRLGWGRYHQFQRPYELQIEDGVEEFQQVETCEHRQIVLEHRFGDGLRWRGTVYEKLQHGVRSWFENMFDPLSLAPELRPDRVQVESRRARSLGLELMLQGRIRWGLDWSASYVVSSVEDEIGSRHEPRAWDQRHAVDLGLIYRWKDRWEVGASFSWHSGWPTTAVGAELQSPGGGPPVVVPILGPRNGERYPDYARLDMRVARRLQFGTHGFELFVDAANLTNRENVCCTDSFDFDVQPDNSVIVTPEARRGLQRTYSLGVTWTF